MARWLFWIVFFFCGGSIIAFFLPTPLKYPFGFVYAIVARWAIRTLTETKEVSNG